MCAALDEVDPHYFDRHFPNGPQHLSNALSYVIARTHKLDDKKRAEQSMKAVIESVIGDTDSCGCSYPG